MRAEDVEALEIHTPDGTKTGGIKFLAETKALRNSTTALEKLGWRRPRRPWHRCLVRDIIGFREGLKICAE
jgi:hypothetical protein